ncbi:MAG: HypC/HybG/HupF family hydrogenase formation chaperone [Chloroflexi bacterium]|nr:HypC/HybG/HupF family hydrogenase formation chaperone [Chloroflexota bacterium]
MCVNVPMQVVEIQQNQDGMLLGRACFEGVVKDVSFQLLPAVRIGDYVMVQFGLATVRLEPAQAQETLALLRELDQLWTEDKNL